MSFDTGSGALRCFMAYHPDARINFVTFGGRSVWMTQKQYAIWRVCLDYKERGKLTSLANIAQKAERFGPRPSIATVSRFLRKLDLWRFIDLVTLTGRRGGTAILTRRGKTWDREAWLAGARHTWASRRIARDKLLARWRALWEEKPRPNRTPRYYRGKQMVMDLPHPPYRVPGGSTGAKFRASGGGE